MQQNMTLLNVTLNFNKKSKNTHNVLNSVLYQVMGKGETEG